MCDQYFALINLNLKLKFCAKASFSLLLILLVPEDVPRVSGECLHINDGVIVAAAGGAQGEQRVEGKCRVGPEHLDDEVTKALRLLPSLEAV